MPNEVELLKLVWTEQGMAIAWNEPVKAMMMKDGNIQAACNFLLEHIEETLTEFDRRQGSKLVLPE